MFKYKKAGLGGTFDHFHKGHQAFLLFASQLAEHLVIGITTPEMIRHKRYFSQIESYETRAESVTHFTKNFFNKVDVIPLTDPYGPTLIGSNVDALIATTATKNGAETVNVKRKGLGLPSLPISVCNLENDENGEPLASERIRAGLVNRVGKVYKNIFRSTLVLTDKQKQFFSEQHGKLVHTPSPNENIFVVGDSSLEAFIKHNWPYQLGVVDFLKNRKPYHPPLHLEGTSISTQNQPSEIAHEMAEVLDKALQSKVKHVIIEGEEDLAAVALVLLAPLGTAIYYGQPGKGMIEMPVTEKLKDDCLNILRES